MNTSHQLFNGKQSLGPPGDREVQAALLTAGL